MMLSGVIATLTKIDISVNDFTFSQYSDAVIHKLSYNNMSIITYSNSRRVLSPYIVHIEVYLAR